MHAIAQRAAATHCVTAPVSTLVSELGPATVPPLLTAQCYAPMRDARRRRVLQPKPNTTATNVNGAGKLSADDTAQPLLRGGLLGVVGKTGAGVGLAGSTFAGVGSGVGFGVGGVAGSGDGWIGSAGAGPGVQYMRETCGPWQVPFLPSKTQGVPAAEPMQMDRAGSIGPISAEATCPVSIKVETKAPSVSANF